MGLCLCLIQVDSVGKKISDTVLDLLFFVCLDRIRDGTHWTERCALEWNHIDRYRSV